MTLLLLLPGVAVFASAAADAVAVGGVAPFSLRGTSVELNGLVDLSPLQCPRRSSSSKRGPFPLEKPESEIRERFDVRRGDVAAALVAAANAKDITFDLRKSTARAPRRAGALRRWPCRPTRSPSAALAEGLLERRRRWPYGRGQRGEDREVQIERGIKRSEDREEKT